jgi:alkylation response protein AidB-like acyl-CoA dehydrogenase
MVDVQNTLINNAVKKWGNAEQQKQYFPRLAQNTVASFCLSEWGSGSDVRNEEIICWQHSAS